MTSTRNESLLLTVFLLGLVGLLINYALSAYTGLHALHMLYPYLVTLIVLSAALWVRFRFHRLAATEASDRQKLRQRPENSSLFGADTETDSGSYSHARDQYEKWFMPGLAPLLAVGMAWWAWRIWPDAARLVDLTAHGLFAAACLFGQAFVWFLFGRLLLGLSRIDAHRWLRGVATFLLLLAWGYALTGAAAMVTELASPAADGWMRRIGVVYLWGVSLEWIVNTIGYWYRPRRKDDWVRTYESRLTALLTDPRSWTIGLAQTLDYQFGFSVSETGFYRFLRRALLPLISAQILFLYGLSAVVVIGPEERAILERLGQPLTATGEPRYLSSGLHLTWPWPFDQVRRYPAQRVLTTHVGYEIDPDQATPPVLLWTQPHFLREETFVVANRDWMAEWEERDQAVPVNFITVNVPIQYQITNLYHYVYTHTDADELLRLLTYRHLTRELAGRDLIELLGADRKAAGRALFESVQADADALSLGVEILFLGLHGVHPPIPVAPAFEAVIGSLEERETAVLTARAYRNRVLPLAAAEGDEQLWLARADRARRVEAASGEADQFDVRRQLAEAFPRIYTGRLYFDVLERALAPVPKWIVATSPDLEVLIVDGDRRSIPDWSDQDPRLEGRFR